MRAKFWSLNNNDTAHEIDFKSITFYADGTARITVRFDGMEYTANVITDDAGNMSFKKAGKTYDFFLWDRTII